jgi:thiamine biosynthesis lipoprotein
MPVERRFRAMGSDAHVLVVGGPRSLALEAQHRIADLERRWSRFDPQSEVSALTRFAGSPVVVSPETLELVERALAAWRFTRGLFDPTVLGALVRAGYDRSFEHLDQHAADGSSALTTGAGAIDIVANTVRLPAHIGFDPGGIGKGLAADIVTDELRAQGATGVCVNLGGDVRVSGTGPSGNAWSIAVDHPEHSHPLTRIGLAHGAVATSTTLRRSWQVGGELRHHLIDPTTGKPSVSDLTFVTVIAGHAWMAEVLAKAVLLHGAPHQFELLAGNGAAALAIDRDGSVSASLGIDAYLAEPLHPSVAREFVEPPRELASAS